MERFNCGKRTRGIRSWTEISLSCLENNLKIYKENANQISEIMAVVKADAYGHGDKVVSKFLSERGVNFFAVSNIDEAISVRQVGVTGVILILGYTPISRLHELVKYNITQTLLSEEYAASVAETGLPIVCEFAVDTGMRRIGLNCDDLDKCEGIIREYSKILNINGIFTHLCVADSQRQIRFTVEQIQLFDQLCKRISDLDFPYRHCMNSAGGLWYQSKFSNINRLGIILYGLKPDYENTLPEGVNPVMSWKSVVSMVKEIRAGDTIGYGRSYSASKNMRIATIPTGYADGYPRLLSNKGWVLINGYKANIVGNICMDQMMVDVSDIPDIRLEHETCK